MLTVSVIIPNYNRAALIGETIDNMLSQSLPPHEVIVVDDGSTDNSVEVIKSFGNRVTLIQQTNKGAGAARNAGLKIASGEFIQFMDSDDLASLNKLEVQAKALEQENADIVYGPWAKVWFQQDLIQLENVVLQQKPLPESRSPLHWFLTSWSMVFQQCLVRKSLLDRVGGYREDMQLYEDGELFLRLLLAKAKLVHENQSLTLYRLGDSNKLTESGSTQTRKLLDKAKFYLIVAELLAKNYQQQLLHNFEFNLRIWQTLNELNKSLVNDRSLTGNLEQIIANCNFSLMNSYSWIEQKSQGLKQRLCGHRWSNCYQANIPNSQQQELLANLGFQVVAF
ncbi:MAG: glycosyltransferase family 2 protein [Xenococcaceae cyanobacterium]